MLQVEMTASVRSTSGKGAMRRLRMDGMTPAVVYGDGGEAVSLQMNTKKLMAQLLEFNRRNCVIALDVDGSTKSVVVGEIQTDPVRDTLVHVDFCEIDVKATRSFNVPVVFEGISKGVELGGELNIIHQTVVLSGKPLDIPDECVLDITELEIGDNIKCAAITIPESVEKITAATDVVVAVNKPGKKQAEESEEGEEAVVEEEATEASE